MSPKRGESVAPPAGKDEYDVRYLSSEAVTGWRELGNKAPGNTRRAWDTMRTNPAPQPETDRHHRLKYDLATCIHKGEELPQWQIEVLGGGRIWYLIDQKRRIVWLKLASVGHPKRTE